MMALLFAAAITCTAPHIADGDTLTCDGTRIRLWGMDAPELHGTRCRGGYDGWACDPAPRRYARRAADRLYHLTRGRVTCRQAQESHSYGRMVAMCHTDTVADLGGEIVREGLARDYPRFSRGRYAVEELRARRAHEGMWADDR